MNLSDVATTRCPECCGELEFRGVLRAHQLEEGVLECRACRAPWPVKDSIPYLFSEAKVRGNDRLMRVVNSSIARIHDPLVRYFLPVLQLASERRLRDGYMRRLALETLRPPRDGGPVRILEIGVGAGANLSLIARDAPRTLDMEIWALDLSLGMLRECRRRLGQLEIGERVRLLAADAHALPFAPASFDRVFNVGGIGGFRSAETALAEMVRVAKPGTPIVVVDEQLDPQRGRGLYFRIGFRMISMYVSKRCPTDLLPAGAHDVVEEQLTRFYYCLTFRC